jgi:hypothetical protein
MALNLVEEGPAHTFVSILTSTGETLIFPEVVAKFKDRVGEEKMEAAFQIGFLSISLGVI